MSWLLLSWSVALLIVCWWIYAATRDGNDFDEEQLARKMRNAA